MTLTAPLPVGLLLSSSSSSTTTVSRSRKPPLDIYWEVEDAYGTRYRWDGNQSAANRLQGATWRTRLGEGFADGGGRLSRRADLDYPDLRLVNNVTAYGAEGDVRYEGRISAMPREIGDTHSIGVTLTGWMAHARDRKMVFIGVDRDSGRWTAPSQARQAAMATASEGDAQIQASAGNGALKWTSPSTALATGELAELHYDAGPGATIEHIAYQGDRSGSFVGFEAALVYNSDAQTFASTGNVSLGMDNTERLETFTTPRRYLMARIKVTAGPVTPAIGHGQTLAEVAVFGDHDLTRYDIGRAGGGLYASDMIRHLIANWCPLLNANGVQDTDYAIGQAAWPTPTHPYDAFLELNKYHLWELACWEHRTIHFRPYDLTDYDWEIRTDDPGTTWAPQGDAIDDLFNGIDVTYTDLLTGAEATLRAADYDELLDTDPLNPWNEWGIPHYDEIALTTPTLEEQALQLGRAALAERNRPKAPGTITRRGHIRDRAGNWQPVSKVRAGQTVAITNFPNDRPRLIHETTYNDADHSLTIAVDAPARVLDAYLDRTSNALQAAGLLR